MTAPIDQRIIDRLSTLLGRITVANGFETNAGLYVLTEQQRADIPEGADTLAIIDDTETTQPSGQGYLTRRGTLSVSVQGALATTLPEFDASTPREWIPVRERARLLMADVRRAIAGVQLYEFTTGVTGIRITGRSLPRLDDGASHQLCAVNFEFDFSESHTPKEATP